MPWAFYGLETLSIFKFKIYIITIKFLTMVGGKHLFLKTYVWKQISFMKLPFMGRKFYKMWGLQLNQDHLYLKSCLFMPGEYIPA